MGSGELDIITDAQQDRSWGAPLLDDKGAGAVEIDTATRFILATSE
jgi:hypothetical protein